MSNTDKPVENPVSEDSTDSKVENAGILTGKKTQLAVGAAATIGLVLLYKLRQKMRTPADEDDASIEKVKAALREADADARRKARRKSESTGGRRQKDRRSTDEMIPTENDIQKAVNQ